MVLAQSHSWGCNQDVSWACVIRRPDGLRVLIRGHSLTGWQVVPAAERDCLPSHMVLSTGGLNVLTSRWLSMEQ